MRRFGLGKQMALGLLGGGGTTISLPQYSTTSRVLTEDFEDYTAWTRISGVNPAENADQFVTGSKSIRLTNAGSASNMDKAQTPNWALAADEQISIDIYYHSGSSPTFILYFGNDLTWTKFFQCNPALQIPNGAPAGWYHFDIGPGDVMFFNGMTWTDPIKNVRIRNVATNADASFDALYRSVKSTCTPAIMVTFDDAFESVYTNALPIFSSRKMRATMYTISGLLNTATYMTTAQIMDLHNAGWCVANHSDTALTFSGRTQAQIEISISNCKNALIAAGVTGNGPLHLAYPAGIYNAASQAALTAQGFFTARTTVYAPNKYQNMPLYYLNSYQLDNTVSLETALNYVDKAKASNKVCCFYTHKVEAAAAPLTWAAADLAALLDYATDQGLPALTIDDYYRLYSQPITIPKAV